MYVPRNPYFSEFSYGYCLTEELVAPPGTQIRIAPVFPSLIEEGGVGFDVMIDRPGLPLFIQFKLAHLMSRRTAREARDRLLNPPFYRMYLRCSGYSNQHSALLALEREGNDVFYAAPAFHLREQLNDAYGRRQVWIRSFQIRPTDIGDLDNSEHHIAFQRPGSWYVLSEKPSREGETPDPRTILSGIESRILKERQQPLRQHIERLDRSITTLFVQRKERIPEWRTTDTAVIQQQLTPLRRVSYLARNFFDCQLFLASERQTEVSRAIT